MIKWEDVYNVVEAMTPLCVALALGYASVKWWHIFTPQQCDAINSFVSLFTLPLFTFDFTSHVDPFDMDLRFLVADGISKVIVILVLALWVKCCSKGSYGWSITSFSLSTLTNTLVVGVPLLKAMYGPMGQDLVVQVSVVQSLIWFTILLFVFEFRNARMDAAAGDENSMEGGKDIEGNIDGVFRKRSCFWSIMKIVGLKLALNPNSYASIVALAWAFVSNRWHFGMPSIMHKSIQIMSNAGSGMSMFSMGETDRMWAKADLVWNGVEIYCRPHSYGHCIHCSGPAWHCVSSCYHSGSTAAVYHLLHLREGVWIAPRSAQHNGDDWNACFFACIDCILCAP